MTALLVWFIVQHVITSVATSAYVWVTTKDRPVFTKITMSAAALLFWPILMPIGVVFTCLEERA